MQASRPVGRGASARKYDILTALGAFALAREKGTQRLALRFVTLITARYNWTRDELAVGQREIARLWSCDERTVKREMAKLRSLGWLVLRRQGVRGRVAEYRLDIGRIEAATRQIWDNIGPDFAARMDRSPEPGDSAIVPFPQRGTVPAPDVSEGTEWALARRLLHGEDAGTYGAWLARLERAGRVGGKLILRAPSRFHAGYVATHLASHVLAACRSVDPEVTDVRIVDEGWPD